MNILFKVTCVLVFMGLISPTIGKAQTVIQNDALLFADLFGISDYGVDLSGAATGNPVIGIDELPNSQFMFSAFGIAERYDVFQVTPGQVVSEAFVNTTTPFIANTGNAPFTDVLTLAVGDSAFIGYYVDVGFGLGINDSIPTTEDAFGWFELSNTATGLEILDGATAIGFEGIIVGTTTAVPEPGSATLVLGMVAATMLRRRRA